HVRRLRVRARAALRSELGLESGLDARSACFEWVPDPREGTKFDFFVRPTRGEGVFFEFKLSESDFGAAIADERHAAKLRDIYAPRLRGLIDAEHLEPENFFRRYQLLRNLSYLAAPNDVLVLVVPKAHARLAGQATSFMADVSDAAKPRVRLAYMDDIATAMRAAVANESASLALQFTEFASKYCIQ